MWNNVFPSLLIGLREGLGTGLAAAVLAALPARTGARERLGAVWTGAAAAFALGLSAAAVLTYTSAGFPADGQAALDGVLSVLAVCLVTVVVFFPTRRGAGTLALAAFLAVGHEGLDTALYLWMAVKSAGQAHSQLLGAALGILLAVLLCWGLYRGVRKNGQASVGVLIVLAAGVLAYGLGELQAAGWLPGHAAHAFDLSSIDAGSWYASLITGTLNLTPVMTWLQIAGYLVFLAATVVVLAYGTRAVTEVNGGLTASPRTPRWTVYGAIVAVPALAAVATISVMGTANASSTPGTIQIAINETSCGTGWTSPTAGTLTFNVTDNGASTAEVYLINPDSNIVYGEDPDVTPGSNEIMNVELAAGKYVFRCSFIDGAVLNSAVYDVTGSDHAPAGVAPVNEQDMELPVYEYRAYVETALPGLLTAAEKLDADLKAGNLAAARTDWLPAHLAYERLGAAYGTFDDFDTEINGSASGQPEGTATPSWTGFFRIEYGLWHGQSSAVLAPLGDKLVGDIHGLAKAFPGQTTPATDLPLRTHEILENALQFQLTGIQDYGSGTTLDTLYANTQGTQAVLATISSLIQAGDPSLLSRINQGITTVQTDLKADGAGPCTTECATPTPLGELTTVQRQKVDADLSELLETLSLVPDLLEERTTA
jgi:high-affinity iron transporter